jgi:hypothetical protein
MDCHAGLLIEAVESVDERPAQCLKGGQFVAELPKENKIGVEEVYRA